MSAILDLLDLAPEAEVADHRSAAVELPAISQAEPGYVDHYADEQILQLVRRVYFPGWPTPCRQVAFCAVDKETDLTGLCWLIGYALDRHAPGTACVVETGARPEPEENDFGRRSEPAGRIYEPGSLRRASRQISSTLWHMSAKAFACDGAGLQAAGLHGRLAELRMEFDYTVLVGATPGSSGEAALLGKLCDGVVLVIEAGTTRRLAAQKTKAVIEAANARLLGTVLSGRTFPIPERLYRSL